MKRLLVLLMLLSLLVAACGGGDTEDGGDDNADQPTATQAPSGDDSDDAPPTTSDVNDDEDDSEPEGEGPSTATVTIGDMTYEFSSEGAIVAQCLPDLFGIMSVQLPMADGGDGSIELAALHEGTDPAVVGQINAITVKIGDDDWVADPEDVRIAGNADYEGLSQVDSVTVSGSNVTGTATFVNTSSFDGVESATGTFEATCGEERTS